MNGRRFVGWVALAIGLVLIAGPVAFTWWVARTNAHGMAPQLLPNISASTICGIVFLAAGLFALFGPGRPRG